MSAALPEASAAVSRTAHLKPYQWKPGQTGNPKGANGYGKVRDHAAQLFDARCHDLVGDGSDARLKIDALMEAFIDFAIAGHPVALKMAIDRLLPVAAAAGSGPSEIDPAAREALLARLTKRLEESEADAG